MSPFTRWENHQESLSYIALTVEEVLGQYYECGHAFFRDLKLVSAQIEAKDWMVLDLKHFAMKVKILHMNLVCAVKAGSNNVLMNFDS